MRSVTALAAFFLAMPVSAEAPAAGSVAFARLSDLVGTWRIADKPDSPLRIRFALTAGGTVLVESWERDGRSHSLTLYHRDGAALIATHYCPQGNQPRLAFDPESLADGVIDPPLQFRFRDATDLDAGESHLHDLRFDLTDPARIIRSEIYRKGDVEEPSSLVLTRVPSAS